MKKTNRGKLSGMLFAMTLVLVVLSMSQVKVNAETAKVTISQDSFDENLLVLDNGQNTLLINGAVIQVGDKGKGWSYPKADMLKLTGGSAIHSIVVTDNLKDPDHITGSRKFTIEVSKKNTISSSSDLNKSVEVNYPVEGGTGLVLSRSVMISDTWGITIMGSVTFTGSGSLVLNNAKKKEITDFVNAYGDIKINGPTIEVNPFTAPGKVTISDVKSVAGGKAVIKIKEVKDAKGYEITYSTSSKITASTTKKVNTTKLSTTIKELTKGKVYYIKVRAYRTDDSGKKIYGAYSTMKKITAI